MMLTRPRAVLIEFSKSYLERYRSGLESAIARHEIVVAELRGQAIAQRNRTDEETAAARGRLIRRHEYEIDELRGELARTVKHLEEARRHV